jgi:hypothetical protein
MFLGVAAKSQPGSSKCNLAQQAVADEQNKIQAFEISSKNNPAYQGDAGYTVYRGDLAAMQKTLQSLMAGATVACSKYGEQVIEGDIRPKYVILTVVYAPPGTAGGKAPSFVDYSTGTTLGSTFTGSTSYKQDYSISVTTSVGSSAGSGASVGFGLDWNDTVTTKNEFSVTQSNKNDIRITSGSTDGIDHDYDEIYLMLNPIVHVTVNGEGTKLSYSVGTDGPTADIQYVYPPWLKDPSLIPSNVMSHFQARGMIAEDFTAILKVDPFATGTPPVGTGRFLPTGQTLPYETVESANAPTTGNSVTLTNEQLVSGTHEDISSNTVSIDIEVSAGFPGIAKIALQNDDKFTWTYDNSTTNSTTTTSTSVASVGNPSSAYTGPTDIGVYWDTMFNSFVFAPINTASLNLSGFVSDVSGASIWHRLVTLKTVNGRTYRTYTDHNGGYRFYGVVGPGTDTSGELTVEGGAPTKVTLGTKPVKLDLPFKPLRH